MHDRQRGFGSSSRSRPGRSSNDRRDDRERGYRPRTSYPDRPRPSFSELFRTEKAIVGVVHLKPLPGSPGYEGHFLDILNAALDDARAIEDGGAAGLIVENFGDAPFYPDRVPAETIACLTRLVTEIRKAVRIPVGVNVLRNDALGGVAIAAATGAGFVRVNVHTGAVVADQGVIMGRAYETMRLRETLRCRSLLFSDIRVKHAKPMVPFDLLDEAFDAVKRGKSDALIVTGAATGRAADLDDVRRLKEKMPEVPVMIGSGATPETVEEILAVADGIIVGTAIKEHGEIHRPVDAERVRAFADVAERLSPRRRREPRSWEAPPPADSGEAAPPAAESSNGDDPAPAPERRPRAAAYPTAPPPPEPDPAPVSFGRSPVRRKRR